MITDANACTDEETLDQWDASRDDGKPFVLAINEWPLYVLQRARRSSAASPRSPRRCARCTTARFFVEAQTPRAARRRTSSSSTSACATCSRPVVVERVIDRLTQDRFFAGLNADPTRCSPTATRCASRRCASGWSQLLEMVATRTGHVTMRQLVGFVAYLITGGQSADRPGARGQDTLGFSYSNLAFEGGEGALFEAVRACFRSGRGDPSRTGTLALAR